MNLLSVENAGKAFGVKTLFDNITFGVAQGRKIALVAKNGAGKTTLLKMLMGTEPPDSGRIVFRNNLTIGYLAQEPQFDEKATVLETLFASDTPALRVIKHYEALLDSPGSDAAYQKALADAMEQMEHLQAWDYEYKIKEILSHLQLHHLHQTIQTLSGGQRKRVALARVLIEEPELLILDEPTNHLDLDMIEWLESYLSRPEQTLFLVTHDRYFLDRICDEILELERGTLYRHIGNYSYFLEKKEEREFKEGRELNHTRNVLRKELQWIRRQPKARTTKSKARVDAFYVLQEKAEEEIPDDKLKLAMQMKRIGGKILELRDIEHRFGNNTILNGFSYSFKKGERIGLVGRNGAGKTTFLEIITGRLHADHGTIETGETITFGYYSQKGLLENEQQRVIDLVRSYAEVIPMADGSTLSASQFLNQFLFPPELQHTPVYKLSGGEKRRLFLLTVLIKNPNFLILDEPTNDLDLITLSVLEEFLLHFQGCLLIVSHDRYFMDRLVDHIFVFEGDGVIRDFIGNYGEYREAERVKETVKDTPAEKIIVKDTNKKTKLSYKEKIEFENLEKEIAALEKEKNELENKLNRGSADYIELQKWSERLSVISQTLDEKSMRWLELAEYASAK
ncbi:MAG TPA: ABC-F family ATP-binding cassette domain-containing protein [bacterium]|nr:ABC-F family ATP-binding cassette domain-containing protein [bacterium]HNJ71303.1 ABC-F family ATP-binding cassette domain-containing protein [bacterium]HNO90733.1 ABC-F family ATP-binding cassette domain-containing protein [bacterium]